MKHSNIAFFVPHLGCPHVCSFCDQRSISGASRQPQPQEVREVCGHALKHMTQQQRQNTEIAFFGGSFTAIDRETMLGLLEAAAPFCGAGKLAGIRISTRPDAVSEEILRLLRQYRVSAVELGAQSMDDRVLALNRRGHTAAQTIEAFAAFAGVWVFFGASDDDGPVWRQQRKRIPYCGSIDRLPSRHSANLSDGGDSWDRIVQTV